MEGSAFNIAYFEYKTRPVTNADFQTDIKLSSCQFLLLALLGSI